MRPGGSHEKRNIYSNVHVDAFEFRHVGITVAGMAGQQLACYLGGVLSYSGNAGGDVFA